MLRLCWNCPIQTGGQPETLRALLQLRLRRWDESLHRCRAGIQGTEFAFQQLGKVPDFCVIYTPQPGLDFRNRAAIQIPPGKLCLAGKRRLCPVGLHTETGKIPANAVLLKVNQYRSLTLNDRKENVCFAIGIFDISQPCSQNETRVFDESWWTSEPILAFAST